MFTVTDYCFMSDRLREVPGLEWIGKGTVLPRDSETLLSTQIVPT